MTVRAPLYYDGSNSLIEMSSGEVLEYVKQAIFQYASDPSVTCSQVSGSGNISPTMNDTRFFASAAVVQASSHPGSGALQTTTTNFDINSTTTKKDTRVWHFLSIMITLLERFSL